MSFAETVADRAEGYSKRQVQDAKEAEQFRAVIGYPSTRDYKAMIKGSMLKNCPVLPEDVNRAEEIFGKNVPSLKGKTIRKKPDPVRHDIISVPPHILEKNNKVVLDIDVFFVNKIPFFHTLSQNLYFGTVQNVPDSKSKTILSSLTLVIKLYASRGFRIRVVNGDNAFEPLREGLSEMAITLNITAAKEHVPCIERRQRVIKERCQAIRHSLPFTTVPRIITVNLVMFVVHWLNAFPVKNGVSDTISPGLLLTGKVPDFNKHCKLMFGSYVQTHEENTPRNNQVARSLGAIALGPDTSQQAGHWFMNLNTGRKIHRRSWTALPMLQEVVKG